MPSRLLYRKSETELGQGHSLWRHQHRESIEARGMYKMGQRAALYPHWRVTRTEFWGTSTFKGQMEWVLMKKNKMEGPEGWEEYSTCELPLSLGGVMDQSYTLNRKVKYGSTKELGGFKLLLRMLLDPWWGQSVQGGGHRCWLVLGSGRRRRWGNEDARASTLFKILAV